MRIEIIPNNWEASPEAKRGDGTPTVDVCKNCLHFFEEKAALPLYLNRRYRMGTVGSTDVAHPSYEDEMEYYCDCCGDKLDYTSD